MKIWRCDFCGKEKQFEGDNYSVNTNPFPKDWFMIKIYSKAQSKGGKSRGYHLCKKCKRRILLGNER